MDGEIAPGELALDALLASLEPRLKPGEYLFVTVPEGAALPSDVDPIMQFREEEGTTYILPADWCSMNGIEGYYRCRMITLQIQSSLNAVGMLAAILAGSPEQASV